MRTRSGLRGTPTVVVAIAVVVALLLGATGCGGGGDGSSGTTIATADADGSGPGTTIAGEQVLLRAALAYNQALFDPAVTAETATTVHEHQAASCRDEWTVDDLQGLMVDWVEQRRIAMDAVADELSVGQVTVDGIHGGSADVLVTIVAPDDPDPMGWGVPLRQTWFVEDGTWRTDLCAGSGAVDGATDQFQPVRVLAAGMHQMNGDTRWSANWAAVVNNPNGDAMAADIEVSVELLDDAGEVVTTDDVVLIDIDPGASGAISGLLDAPGATTVRVTARARSWIPTDVPTPLPGEVTEVTSSPPEFVGDAPGTEILIDVTNPNQQDLGALPVVVYLDATGRVVGGSTPGILGKGYLSPGETGRFFVSTPEAVPEDWRLVVYVTPLAPDYSSPYADLVGEGDDAA